MGKRVPITNRRDNLVNLLDFRWAVSSFSLLLMLSFGGAISTDFLTSLIGAGSCATGLGDVVSEIDKKDRSSQMSSSDRLMVSSSSATNKFWKSTSLQIGFGGHGERSLIDTFLLVHQNNGFWRMKDWHRATELLQRDHRSCLVAQTCGALQVLENRARLVRIYHKESAG